MKVAESYVELYRKMSAGKKIPFSASSMRKVSAKARRHPFIAQVKGKVVEAAKLGQSDLQVVRVDAYGTHMFGITPQEEDGAGTIFFSKDSRPWDYGLSWKDPVLEREFYNYFYNKGFRVVSRHFDYEDDIYGEVVIEW